MVATFDSPSVVAVEQAEARLSLVNGFDLRLDMDRVEMPLHAQRLLTFLALRPHPMVRGHVAGRLWPDTDEGKASANLRSVVWRIERHGHGLLDSTRTHIRISPRVKVDVIEAVEIARRLDEDADDAMLLSEEVRQVFSMGELLPDWYDEEDWLAAERTRFHQIRLHALERLSKLLLARGRHHEAVDAALAAVTADPLRESAHRSVIAAHLAEGNHVEAIRQYDFFRRLLAEEMGSSPSPQMESLMAPAW